jgi:hypothetical protein
MVRLYAGDSAEPIESKAIALIFITSQSILGIVKSVGKERRSRFQHSRDDPGNGEFPHSHNRRTNVLLLTSTNLDASRCR